MERPQQQGIQLQGRTMGTYWSIKSSPSTTLKDTSLLRDQIIATLETIEQSMSTYRSDSELSKLNRAPAGVWHSISVPLYEVLWKAQTISKKSEGAFDVTLGALVNAWGFGAEKRPAKVPNNITALIAATGWHKYRLKKQQGHLPLFLKESPLLLDLSAIAKGYAVDKLVELLEPHGFSNFMVDIGGEIKTRGQNFNGTPWRIAIETPTKSSLSSKVQALLLVRDVAVATSGDYRNYQLIDNQYYSHIIDNVTGKPVRYGVVSATIISEHCADADAWATALMAMPAEQGMALAVKENLAVYLLETSADGTYKAIYSPAFKPYLSNF